MDRLLSPGNEKTNGIGDNDNTPGKLQICIFYLKSAQIIDNIN